MKRIKGINAVTYQLNKFLKSNRFKCRAAFGSEFQYWENQRKIDWSLYVPNAHDDVFLDLLQEWGLKYDCDTFILNFFHELGHHATRNDLTDEQQTEYYYKLRYYNSLKTFSRQDAIEYYNLDMEKFATMWAIDYINNHPDKVRKFWSKVQPKILNIYKLNNELDILKGTLERSGMKPDKIEETVNEYLSSIKDK